MESISQLTISEARDKLNTTILARQRVKDENDRLEIEHREKITKQREEAEKVFAEQEKARKSVKDCL